MGKDFVWSVLVWAIIFMWLWMFMWYKIGINKYENYYYYYINQYPAMETINHIQDMSNNN